jgi:hypothetical protein
MRRHIHAKGGDNMKKGVIIYAAGDAPRSWTESHEQLVRSSVPGAEAVEIITSGTGHYDVLDAWWALSAKGMAHIECRLAVFGEDDQLKETGRTIRLCG